MTGMLRWRATPISIRTKSCGLSKRRLPSSSRALSQLGPITASSTSLGDLLAEHLDKVDPQRDGVDIHEQEVAAELPFQPIMHSASVARAIVTAIADEDLSRHHQIPGGRIPKYYTIKRDSPCTTLLRP